MNLQGKTALVTGSTSGIGLGIALKLARPAATMVLNGFGDVDAALAASVFHSGAVAIPALKRFLRGQGIEVRL